MPHVDRVLQIEFFGESREVIGVGVHVVTVPGLGGPAVSTPVSRDDTIALLPEEQHLSVPVVGGEWPAVAEHNGLPFSPVFVVNLRSVFCGDCWHKGFSC